MTEADPNLNELSAPEPLLRLQDQDRARLAEALQELLAHGSLLGLESGQSALYNWCRQNFEWLRETAALAGTSATALGVEAGTAGATARRGADGAAAAVSRAPAKSATATTARIDVRLPSAKSPTPA